MSEFIRKCIGNVVPTATIKTFPNQKPWIDGSIRVKLKAQTTAFNQGKVTGNITEYKQYSCSFHKAIKQAKCQYRDKVESQFKTCRLSFTAADVSKTFKRVNPRKNAGPDGIPSRVLRACADQLAGVFTDIYSINPYPSLLYPHASRGPPLFLFPRKLR